MDGTDVNEHRLDVRHSRIHGYGVFALTGFEVGDVIVEYRGEVVPWATAQARYARGDAPDGHTFFFDRSDGNVIDGGRGGNASRWLNHGCDPNCEAFERDLRIFIAACRPIRPGDELLVDYRLVLDESHSAVDRASYACACGQASCRGTMLDLDGLVDG